jgi:hypothetical protein
MDMLTCYIPVTFDKICSIAEKDKLLPSVKKFTKSRCSGLRYLCQHPDWLQLKELYRCRGYLTIEKGFILFMEPLVILTVLRTDVLKLLNQ